MKPISEKAILIVDEYGTVPLTAFAYFVDTDKVHYYSLKQLKDGTIHIKFYDNKKKLIKPSKVTIT